VRDPNQLTRAKKRIDSIKHPHKSLIDIKIAKFMIKKHTLMCIYYISNVNYLLHLVFLIK